jgi:hypothetical protein
MVIGLIFKIEATGGQQVAGDLGVVFLFFFGCGLCFWCVGMAVGFESPPLVLEN